MPIFYAILSNKFGLGQEQSLHSRLRNSPLATLHSTRLLMDCGNELDTNRASHSSPGLLRTLSRNSTSLSVCTPSPLLSLQVTRMTATGGGDLPRQDKSICRLAERATRRGRSKAVSRKRQLHLPNFAGG